MKITQHKGVEIPKDMIPAEIIGKEFGVYVIFVSGRERERNRKIKLINKFIKKLK